MQCPILAESLDGSAQKDSRIKLCAQLFPTSCPPLFVHALVDDVCLMFCVISLLVFVSTRQMLPIRWEEMKLCPVRCAVQQVTTTLRLAPFTSVNVDNVKRCMCMYVTFTVIRHTQGIQRCFMAGFAVVSFSIVQDRIGNQSNAHC